MKRKKNHEPEKIKSAWQLKHDGYTVMAISKILHVPYDTLKDWFCIRTRVRLNMRARREAYAAK